MVHKYADRRIDESSIAITASEDACYSVLTKTVGHSHTKPVQKLHASE